jgi:hypothetical protein
MVSFPLLYILSPPFQFFSQYLFPIKLLFSWLCWLPHQCCLTLDWHQSTMIP